MARQSTSSTTSKTGDEKRTAPPPDTADVVAAHGTGREPDSRGVHVPGSAPGQWSDQGPVTVPADAPRTA